MSARQNMLLQSDAGDGAGGGLPAELAEQVEMYLDGLLEGAARDAFEARLAADGTLRAHVQELRAMDAMIGASLRERFAPAAVALPEAARVGLAGPDESGAGALVLSAGGATEPTRSLLQRVGWLRIAAAVVLAGAAVFVFSMRQQYSTPLVSPDQAYRSIVSAGFKPYLVCTDEREFIEYTRRTLGVGLRVRPTDGVALIGWNKDGDVLSDETDALLATVDGEQVIVFMDKQSNKRSLPTPAPGLNVFQRDLEGLTLVEVTPRSESAIIDQFEKP
jgi:hypothetical protein